MDKKGLEEKERELIERGKKHDKGGRGYGKEKGRKRNNNKDILIRSFKWWQWN